VSNQRLRRALVLGLTSLLVAAAGAAPSVAAPPVNDEAAGALTVTSLPYTNAQSVGEATTSPNDPFGWCFPIGGYTVWYTYTPVADQRIQVDTFGSGPDTTLTAFTGSPSSLSQVGCNDNSGGSVQSRIVLDVLAGASYYFVIGSYGLPYVPDNVQFNVAEASPGPDNDDFDHARPIASLPFTDQVDSTSALAAPDDPSCYSRDASVWWAWTAPVSGRIEANTFGSDYYTTLGVFTGQRGALSYIACNASGFSSDVQFDAVEGVTYYFMVASWNGSGGRTVLNVRPGPPPLSVSVAFDRQSAVTPSTGAAVVNGTVTCSRLAYVLLFGQLRQVRGGQTIEGSFWTSVTCDVGGATHWAAPVTYGTPALFRGRSAALFSGGRAEVTVWGYAWDPARGESRLLDSRSTVTLTGGK